MLDFHVSYDAFGGRKVVFEHLCSLGVLSTKCPQCQDECKAYYLGDRSMPQLRCRCGLRFSSLRGSVFEKHAIEDIPLFLFVLKCFVLRVPTKAVVGLSGAKMDTIAKYLNAIRDSLCLCFDETARDPSFMFGGEGKVVEVDEAFICHRKYHRGRPEAKEGVWVVGITEVDTSSHQVTDPAMMKHLKDREDAREKAAEAALARRKKCKVVKKATVRVLRGPAPRIATHDPGVGELFGVDAPEITVPVPEQPADPAQPAIDRDKEVQVLFSQARKGKAKKTIFFVVEHRDAKSLEKIIGEYVIPGSTIHTDEWGGYSGLTAMGYKHQTICHKKRFSRFIFEEEIVTRITTNHI